MKTQNLDTTIKKMDDRYKFLDLKRDDLIKMCPELSSIVKNFNPSNTELIIEKVNEHMDNNGYIRKEDRFIKFVTGFAWGKLYLSHVKAEYIKIEGDD